MKVKFRKSLKYLVTILLTVIVTLFCAFLLVGGDIRRISEQTSLIKKVCTIDTKMNKYALEFDADKDTVGDVIANSYLSLLKDDKYSAYFNEKELKERNLKKEGISDKSIGITIATKSGEKYPIIVYVNRNCPAKKAGIIAGDKILKINNKSLKNKNIQQAADYIKENETANLLLKRNGKKVNVSVKLGEFTADSVIYRMINKTCLIKITGFDDATVDQFDEAIKFAKKNKAKALIFDLRNNPGGYVESCAKILDRICPEGDLVKMRYKNGKEKVLFTSDKEEINMPMAVLINGNSASASEIFAMNIRDYNKGKLIGEKSFGKGIAQTTYELGDSTAIKFTTETVIDKNGKTYHKKGLEPDIEVKFTEKQNENYLFLTDKEDTQLQKALQEVNK